MDNNYVSGGEIIGDAGGVLDPDEETYTDDGQVCTAAGCTGGDSNTDTTDDFNWDM